MLSNHIFICDRIQRSQGSERNRELTFGIIQMASFSVSEHDGNTRPVVLKQILVIIFDCTCFDGLGALGALDALRSCHRLRQTDTCLTSATSDLDLTQRILTHDKQQTRREKNVNKNFRGSTHLHDAAMDTLVGFHVRGKAVDQQARQLWLAT